MRDLTKTVIPEKYHLVVGKMIEDITKLMTSETSIGAIIFYGRAGKIENGLRGVPVLTTGTDFSKVFMAVEQRAAPRGGVPMGVVVRESYIPSEDLSKPEEGADDMLVLGLETEEGNFFGRASLFLRPGKRSVGEMRFVKPQLQEAA